MKVLSYDIEVFPNYMSVIFIDMAEYDAVYKGMRDDKGNLTVTEDEKIRRVKSVSHKMFEISCVEGAECCEILDLLAYTNNAENYLLGFNILGYDNIIINMLQTELYNFKSTEDINKKVYKLSKFIAETDREILNRDPKIKLYKYYKTLYKSIDIQKIPALDKIFKSLKQTLINISWFSINEFMLPPIDEEIDGKYYDTTPEYYKYVKVWDRFIIKDFLEPLAEYNRNDVLGVCELFCFLQDAIILRFNIGAKYDINVLSSSDSNIADKFISKYYSDYTGLEYKDFKDLRTHRRRMNIGKLISPIIKFKTKPFNDLLRDLLQTTVTSTNEIDFPVDFNGVTFDIKSGGLHSRDIPGAFVEDDDSLYKDYDKASYYPNLMLNLFVSPKHLDKDIFLEVISTIIKERLQAKADGNFVDAQVLKISINATYGKRFAIVKVG